VSDAEGNAAERLMGALISKMETMDAGIQSLRAENVELRKMMQNPSAMLRKAGFVAVGTSRPEGLAMDEFRGAMDDVVLKAQDGTELGIPVSNEDFHAMDWADIHALAEQAKDAGAIGNPMGME